MDTVLDLLYRELHYLRIELNSNYELKLKNENPKISLEELHKKINSNYLNNSKVKQLKEKIKQLERDIIF